MNSEEKPSTDKYILFALEDLSTGGVFSVMRMHSEVLIQHGLKPIVVGFDGDLRARELNQFNGRAVFINIGPKSGIGIKNRIKDAFRYLKVTNHVYSKYRVGILHLPLPWPSLYVLLHPRSWSVRKISIFHGSYGFEWMDFRVKYKFLKPNVKLGVVLRNILQLLGFVLSDEILVLSQYSKKLLLEFYSKKLQKKIKIIPGFLTSKHKLLSTSANKRIIIANYGRLEYRKGQDLLIKCAGLLSKSNIDFEFVNAIPYDPAFYLYFKMYESENLFLNYRFISGIDMDRIDDFLRNADIFIMPSRDYETFGLTVIESMARGVPVISSSTGALPETVGDFDKRFLVKPLTPENLAKKILWYMNLKDKEKSKIRKNVYNYVYKKYWWKNYSKQLISLYDPKEN